MNGKFWIVAADVLGVALLVAVLSGGTKSSMFAALILAAPLAMASLMVVSAKGHDA